MKTIPKMWSLFSLSLKTIKNSIAVKNGVREYKFNIRERFMSAKSDVLITAICVNRAPNEKIDLTIIAKMLYH